MAGIHVTTRQKYDRQAQSATPKVQCPNPTRLQCNQRNTVQSTNKENNETPKQNSPSKTAVVWTQSFQHGASNTGNDETLAKFLGK
jgi:hypothetical protein